VGKKVFEFEFNKKSVPLFWKLLHVLAYLFLFRPLKNQFGFLQGRIFASGGAPLSPDLMKFYYSIGVPIVEGYGLTESTGMCFLSRPNEMKIGSVGKPLFGLELKLTDDGEIMLRGDHIFKGYYRNPKGTEEVVKDDWLYTGDVGRIDEDGDLWITDRKKDIIIKLSDKTIYEKTYLDPLETVKINVSRENINIDLVVGIIFTPESRENNLIAKSINISGNNILTGQIISIKNNEIVINEINTKKEYKIVINDKTEYYQENNKENITFPLNLDIVNGDQIKVDENISLFLVKNIDEETNFIAKKIIIFKK